MGTHGKFNNLADKHKFIVVYPGGIKRGWNDGRGDQDAFSGRAQIDDVGFLHSLVDHIGSKLPLDTNRLYATGISNGGMMALRLACESGRFRAVAPVVANLPELIEPACQSQGVSVMLINGTDDNFVPFQGGFVNGVRKTNNRGRVISAVATFELMGKANNCSGVASQAMQDIYNDETTVSRHEFSGCRKGVEVVQYRIKGGGHTCQADAHEFPSSWLATAAVTSTRPRKFGSSLVRRNSRNTTTSGLSNSGLREDNPRSRLQGIALVSTAYLTFAVLIACAKWLGQRLPIIEVVWLRFAVHAVLSIIVLWPQMGPKLLRSKRPAWQFSRAMMMCTMTVCNFTAVQFLPLDVNSAILFLTPLLVALFGYWLLGEQLDPGRWLAIGVGFIGVLIILRPGTEGFHIAMLLTLFATVLYALFGLLTRKLAEHDSPSATQFLSTLGGVALLAPFAWAQWQTPAALREWSIILVLGLAGAAGHWCLATAHRFAPASTITPFMYMQIVYVMIIGYFVFGDIPHPAVYIGTAVVVGSGLYLLHRERTAKLNNNDNGDN